MGLERRLSTLEGVLGTPATCPHCQGKWVQVIWDDQEPSPCPVCGGIAVIYRFRVVYTPDEAGPADQVIQLRWLSRLP